MSQAATASTIQLQRIGEPQSFANVGRRRRNLEFRFPAHPSSGTMFRFIDCREVVDCNKIVLYSVLDGSYGDGGSPWTTLPTIKYAAVSHLWAASGGVRSFDGLDVIIVPCGGAKKMAISSDILKLICNAALSKKAQYLWLDLLCIDQNQSSRKDINWHKAHMQYLFGHSKLCLVLPGGIVATPLALNECSAYFYRVWPLLEILSADCEHVFLVHRVKSSRNRGWEAGRYGQQSSGHTNEQFAYICRDSKQDTISVTIIPTPEGANSQACIAMSPLRDLLYCAATRQPLAVHYPARAYERPQESLSLQVQVFYPDPSWADEPFAEAFEEMATSLHKIMRKTHSLGGTATPATEDRDLNREREIIAHVFLRACAAPEDLPRILYGAVLGPHYHVPMPQLPGQGLDPTPEGYMMLFFRTLVHTGRPALVAWTCLISSIAAGRTRFPEVCFPYEAPPPRAMSLRAMPRRSGAQATSQNERGAQWKRLVANVQTRMQRVFQLMNILPLGDSSDLEPLAEVRYGSEHDPGHPEEIVVVSVKGFRQHPLGPTLMCLGQVALRDCRELPHFPPATYSRSSVESIKGGSQDWHDGAGIGILTLEDTEFDSGWQVIPMELLRILSLRDIERDRYWDWRTYSAEVVYRIGNLRTG
ncbi:hypothetical protein C8Q78DRAFT_850242 [Trametes maxima]|nr:hypothetical protein C8Q78DRAFT_850242 [Trametes maxima]